MRNNRKSESRGKERDLEREAWREQESILQSQFIKKGFKKTEDFEYNVVLLLFLL